MVVGIMRALAAVGVAGILVVGGAAAAQAAPNTWGQQVKACGMASCYPGGESRGAYVSGEARDAEGQGYAWEIHTYACPGKSSPHLTR